MTLSAMCRHLKQALTRSPLSSDTYHVDGSSNGSFDHERPFWSPDEVSALLPPGQSSARVVARWCKRGQVPGAKKLPSGRWVIPAAWVRELLSNGGTPPAANEEHSKSIASDMDPDLPDALPGLEE